MSENLRLARPFFVLLAVFAAGRWTVSLRGVPYERGTLGFSIVILTLISVLYYGAFARRWRGYRVVQAMGLAVTLAVAAQLVILVSTVASYALGLDTYFNHPVALNAEAPMSMGQAVLTRAFGLVVNSLLNGIGGALGWALGGLLPEK